MNGGCRMARPLHSLIMLVCLIPPVAALGAMPVGAGTSAAPRLTIVASARLSRYAIVQMDLIPGAMAIDPTRTLLYIGGTDRAGLEVYA